MGKQIDDTSLPIYIQMYKHIYLYIYICMCMYIRRIYICIYTCILDAFMSRFRWAGAGRRVGMWAAGAGGAAGGRLLFSILHI